MVDAASTTPIFQERPLEADDIRQMTVFTVVT